MRVVDVQIYPWDNELHVFNVGGYSVSSGDSVVVKTDFGLEVGTVVCVRSISDDPLSGNIQSILRIANDDDIEKIKNRCDEKESAKKYCQKKVKKLELPMKIIDSHISLEGSHVVFIFIASSRVDFRKLVRELTGYFQKSIRMHQVGIRDEAKIVGDIGTCGRKLCCKGVIKAFINIRSDLIKLQQLENKTSDRLSGMCGRLMCCLSYESDVYKECCRGVPIVGDRVRYDKKNWIVISRHILKRSVSIRDKDGVVVEVSVDKIKK